MHRRPSSAPRGLPPRALAALALLYGVSAAGGQSLCEDFSVPGAHLGNVTGCDFDGVSTSTVGLDGSAVLLWAGGFNIRSGQNLRFQFGNAGGTVLNRDLSGGPSVIAGGLSSNGRIALINPSDAISITSGAIIEADGGFIASTLDVDDEDALLTGGDVTFSGGGLGARSRITNFGTVRSSAGDVVMISGSVSNFGLLQAPNGAVRIGAGSRVEFLGGGESRVRVIGGNGGNTVVNTGSIAARDTIELAASGLAAAPGDTPPNVIQNDGVIRTTGAGGRVFLRAAAAGVRNSDAGVIETGDLVVESIAPITNTGEIVELDDGSNPTAPSGARQFPRLGRGQLSDAPAADFRLSRLSFSHLNGLEPKSKKPAVQTAPRPATGVAVRGSSRDPKKKPTPKKVLLRRGSFFGKKTS